MKEAECSDTLPHLTISPSLVHQSTSFDVKKISFSLHSTCLGLVDMKIYLVSDFSKSPSVNLSAPASIGPLTLLKQDLEPRSRGYACSVGERQTGIWADQFEIISGEQIYEKCPLISWPSFCTEKKTRKSKKHKNTRTHKHINTRNVKHEGIERYLFLRERGLHVIGLAYLLFAGHYSTSKQPD